MRMTFDFLQVWNFAHGNCRAQSSTTIITFPNARCLLPCNACRLFPTPVIYFLVTAVVHFQRVSFIFCSACRLLSCSACRLLSCSACCLSPMSVVYFPVMPFVYLQRLSFDSIAYRLFFRIFVTYLTVIFKWQLQTSVKTMQDEALYI